MPRFEENNLPKAKLNASSISKAILIFKYSDNHKWKFYVGLLFLLLTGATALAFPKLLGMLVDCVNAKDLTKAKNIALGLMVILFLQSIFSFFRLSLFINFTENTLANIRLALYSNLIKLPMTFFSQKRVGELNSRISSDITQIQDTLHNHNCRIFKTVYSNHWRCNYFLGNYKFTKLTLMMLIYSSRSSSCSSYFWKIY